MEPEPMMKREYNHFWTDINHFALGQKKNYGTIGVMLALIHKWICAVFTLYSPLELSIIVAIPCTLSQISLHLKRHC